MNSWENFTSRAYRFAPSPVCCSYFTLRNPVSFLNNIIHTRFRLFTLYQNNKSSAVAEIDDRGHNRHGSKRGKGLLCPYRGKLGPCLIQCGLGRGLLSYQVASSSIQPFGHNRHGSKIGWGWVCPFSGGSWVPTEHKVTWAEAYFRTKWHLSPSSRLATTDIGWKLGAVPL